MERKKIILSVTNNLETDQRVHKVASTLLDNGFDVLVVGAKNRQCSEYKCKYETKRLSIIFKKGILFYAEFSVRLFLLLLFSKCDIMVANDTDTLLPNKLASFIRNKKLVVDLHELFPEVPEVVNRPIVKKVWTLIEKATLPSIKNGYTVCQSIADYYKNLYGISLKVVRNIPNRREISFAKEKLSFGDKKIILYQGAINVGRGIEWIMEAIPLLDNCVFVVIGKGDLYQDLKKRAEDAKYAGRVIFLGHIPYLYLAQYTVCADLGMCLLQETGLSYKFALPNRIFDYMQAHVPILATDFPEIKKVVETYKTGRVIDHYEPEYLAQVISEMLKEEKNEDIFKYALKDFCWENEAETLIEIYKKA